MSAYVPNSSSRDSKSSFWKAGASVPGSIKPVYGAQHPPMTHKPKVRESPKKEEKVRANKHDAFLNFENSTSDAWDDGDDDLLQMASVQMSLRDVRSSANTVLENHSKQIGSHSQTLTSDADVTTSSGSTHGHSGGGPGVGVRLNSYKTPKTTHVCCVQPSVLDREASKVEKFKSLLAETNIDLDELRQLSWSGIPTCVRPVTWKILAGYLPPNADRREATLERKRREYFGFIDQYYETRHNDMHADTFRQIAIDIPRMNPLIPIFQQDVVQEILKDIPRMTTLAHLMQHKVIQQIFERILFIWAIRHPASGYVQGINDLVTPFFVVFLSEYISNDIEADNCDLKELPKATLDIIEADSFWCTSKLLDGIQDNYTFAQPGIQMKVNALQELIKRIDAPLHKHLVSHNVEYLQFSFRWMNNLLMREIPLRCTIRLWDTYLSEVNGFADFHLYVCASFLVQFSSNILRERDFQGILMFLQNLPTRHWNNKEIGEIMAEAYKLKYMFADAPNHLMKKS